MKKLIYLANAYTSHSSNPDYATFERQQRRTLEAYIAGQLRKKYEVAIIAPIALSAAMADICDFDTGFKEWEGDDLLFISKSDEVWVLLSEGWDTSVGVAAEIAFAKKMNIPIKYVDKDTLALYKSPNIEKAYLGDYNL